MYATVNGTDLYFDVEGAGLVPDGWTMRERPVVLALHGGPGFDHAYFKPALSALTDTAQIIYLDQRCHGRSGRPALESCTIEQMADDIAALCRTLGIAQPVILGHSFGGFVALTLALRHPDPAGGLILVDTAAASDDTADLAMLEARHGAKVRAIAARIFGGDGSESAMADFNRLVFPTYLYDPAVAGAVLGAVARSSYNPEIADYHSANHSANQAGYYDVRARLGEIRTPTLVVVGEADWVCPPRASRAIAAGLPAAELLVLPEAGHFPFGEQPEAFAAAARRFLTAGVPAGVGGI